MVGLLFFFLCYVCAEVVQTEYGPVNGVVGTNYRAWMGIPFASPPVGNLRLAAPAPPTSWTTPLDATKYSASCPQLCNLPPHCCPPTTAEDCLYINVFTPSASKLTTPQPVMVFFHGGAFSQGGASTPIYDGPNFASYTEVVLVTLNYRLGALGFLTTEQVPGNLAFLDQIMALQWVQRNIAAFGGDPTQVTIFGESAGAYSVRAHLVSPLSTGLFHKAIMQSDPLPIPFATASQAIAYGGHFLQNLKCQNATDVLACIRSKSVDEILVAQTTGVFVNFENLLQSILPWTPIVDGSIFTGQFLDLLAAGEWNIVPILAGNNEQDARIFVWDLFSKDISTFQYAVAGTALFYPEFNDIVNTYPPSTTSDNRPILSQLINDYLFTCPEHYLLEIVTQNHPNLPLYYYRWNHSLSWDGWGPNYAECNGKPCHGVELIYEFDPPARALNISKWPDTDQTLSRQMMTYWSNFARTTDPNQGLNTPLVSWPLWSKDQSRVMILQTPTNYVSPDPRRYFCQLWDKLGYKFALHDSRRRR